MRHVLKPAVLKASVVLCGAMLVLGACGDKTTDAGEESSIDNAAGSVEQWQHDFTQCMKAEGIELGEGGGIPVNEDGSFSGDEDSGDFDKALQTCEEKLGPPPAQAEPIGSGELEEQMLAFTQCMREAGYDVPDPDFGSGQGPVISGVPDADPADIERCSSEAGLVVGAGVGQ